MVKCVIASNGSQYFAKLFIFNLLKCAFCLRLKSKSSPGFLLNRSLNLLCVLSVPQHSLATLRIPPQLTCVCVYVTLVLQHRTTPDARRRVA